MENRKRPPGAGKATPEEERRRQKFARALTRSIFGRHYWDRELEDRLQDSIKTTQDRLKQK